MMTKEKAIDILTQQVNLIDDLKNQQPFSELFKKWRRDTEIAIEKIFGSNTRHVEEFNSIPYHPLLIMEYTPESEHQEAFYKGLDDARSILQSMIGEIKEYGIDNPLGLHVEPPKPPTTPWASGSFYLVATILVIIVIGVVSHLSPIMLPIVIIGSILVVLVMVASQLRHDNKLKEATFLSLVLETFKVLPLLRSNKSSKKESNNNE